jgi:acetolactate decarboxylase
MKKCIGYAVFFSIILMIVTGCATRHNQLTQVSTIDAILAGAYDGTLTCGDLTHYGGFGIGTFDGLDGEMVILDGTVYQIKADGKVYRPHASVKTPFAVTVPFESDVTEELPAGTGFASLQEIIGRKVPSKNLFAAVKVRGTFTFMKTRSVPAQSKPYPPLIEVTKTQPVFDLKNVTGTIVGFYSPPYVKGINMPGYHLHFISGDLKSGGHILDFELAKGTVDIDLCNRFFLILPDNDRFGSVDLGIDRSDDLEKTEGLPEKK